MKKLFIPILIFVLLFIPLNIKAKEGIRNYYIEATVLDNGDLKVKELFYLTGSFNGYERIINYENRNVQYFDGSLESFNGSTIYNGNDIELINIKAISKVNNFSDLYNEGTIFTKTNSASKGDFGVYTVNKNYGGYSYLIYNPSGKNQKGFYIEYIIKNIGVVHNDYAEIGWNIFTEEQTEYIDYLEMIINIPNNENELRAWGHGPLTGYTELNGKNQIKVVIDGLKANNAFDVRFLFDKEVLINSNKKTNVNSFDKILELEKEKAEIANQQREEARKQIEHEKRIGNIINVGIVIYLVGLGLIIKKIYQKHDKEHNSTFKNKYFRDIPASYGPEVLNYLINKNIGSKELSTSLLNLIADKFIKFEEQGKGNYILIKEENLEGKRPLVKSEEKLINWFFIGTTNKTSLKEIKKSAKNNYQSFLDNYNGWKNEALADAYKENFFESSASAKAGGILYSIIGIFMFIFALSFPTNNILKVILLILSLGSLIYFATFTKRTIKGNEDYLKWMGLKNFMLDFGNFKERDLPQIVLWEKYLVYATVFGISSKLAKTMKIKFEEMNNSGYGSNNLMFDIYYFSALSNFNRTINSSVQGAVSSAYSAKSVAESRNSSSGGFGGGFSGGGGSFGGGGGGGRF